MHIHSLNSDVATAQQTKCGLVQYNLEKKRNEIIYSFDPSMSGKETANMYRICTRTNTNVSWPT
jgi:hypothetical protein